MMIAGMSDQTLSSQAKQRFLACEGPPLLVSDWVDLVAIHLEAEPALLQQVVPFALDLLHGRAYASLVAFRMRRLRLRRGGRATAWLTSPIANHGFLNLRTYVNHGGERGIYFLAEWLPNRLAVLLGPRVFGLPYRYGQLDYRHDITREAIAGEVRAGARRLAYRARVPAGSVHRPAPAAPGTLEEFVMERYTAFTQQGRVRRRFRIWHQPWDLLPLDVTLEDTSLLAGTGEWLATARPVGAHHACAAKDVWIGPPCPLPPQSAIGNRQLAIGNRLDQSDTRIARQRTKTRSAPCST